MGSLNFELIGGYLKNVIHTAGVVSLPCYKRRGRGEGKLASANVVFLYVLCHAAVMMSGSVVS